MGKKISTREAVLPSVKIPILGVNISATSYHEVVGCTTRWAANKDACVIYAADVHMVMEACDSPRFKNILNSADIVTPDGMPLVWALRHKGCPDQQRVYGPTLMLDVLQAAAKKDIPVGFYGDTLPVLDRLAQNLKEKFPDLHISALISPPFRSLTKEEDCSFIKQINESGAKILFVGLGCPKQEAWIAEHRGKVNAVMIGVGAAFAFHAGMVKQAPTWIQRAGFEWLYRLLQEPRRLWRRYLVKNPRFISLIISEILREKRERKRSGTC